MKKLRENLRDLVQDDCSLPVSLEVIGERWCFMILRASFNGIYHFEDFLSEIGIARNILANRLTRMVEAGVMTRRPCEDDKRKVEYRLTDKGLDLLPTMIALRQWGDRWERGTPSWPILADERDRQPIKPVTIRAHDDRVLTNEDLTWITEEDLSADDRDEHITNIRQLRGIGVAGQ